MKKKIKNSVIERMRARISPETKIFVGKSMELAVRIQDILDEKKWTQKDLAKALGKNESEVSKWLSGSHNLTMKSISKLEAVLGKELIAIYNKRRLIVDYTNTYKPALNVDEGFEKVELNSKVEPENEVYPCAV